MTKRLGLRRGAPLTKGFHTKASLARTACELLGRNGFHGTGLNAGLEIAGTETDAPLCQAFSGEKPVHEKVGALFGQMARSLSGDMLSAVSRNPSVLVEAGSSLAKILCSEARPRNCPA